MRIIIGTIGTIKVIFNHHYQDYRSWKDEYYFSFKGVASDLMLLRERLINVLRIDCYNIDHYSTNLTTHPESTWKDQKQIYKYPNWDKFIKDLKSVEVYSYSDNSLHSFIFRKGVDMKTIKYRIENLKTLNELRK